VWDGRQPARSWAQEQRNVHCWKTLTSSAVKTVTENTSLCVIVICKDYLRFLCKFQINPITDPKPVYNHCITWQYDPASHQIVTYCFLPGGRWPGREANQSPPFNAEIKNACSYTSTVPYIFMKWCLIKHRYNFAFECIGLPNPVSRIFHSFTPQLLNHLGHGGKYMYHFFSTEVQEFCIYSPEPFLRFSE
jgi:hypothetical protein